MILGAHDRAILQFSGGKDSLAALYLARPYLDRIIVQFGDTGSTVPHVLEYVKDTCSKLGAELQIVRPKMLVKEFTEMAGLPSDIVPVWSSNEIQPYLKDKSAQPLLSAMNCCAAMLFAPMHNAVIESGIKLVIRGAKLSDARRGVPPGTVEHGITYDSPVWYWTDEQVFAYLKSEGAELAPHYDQVKSSMDCWLCTAHLRYEDGKNKIAYIREHYPDLWPELRRRLLAVRRAVNIEGAAMNKSMEDL